MAREKARKKPRQDDGNPDVADTARSEPEATTDADAFVPPEGSADDRRERGGWVQELFKRTFYAGVGSIFTSEEGLRRMASEFSLPKDVANYLIGQAQGTKDELFGAVAKEMRGFLEGLNLHEEIQRVLTSLSFEIKTEVRFIPNDKKLKPNVRNRVSVKRTRKPTESDN